MKARTITSRARKGSLIRHMLLEATQAPNRGKKQHLPAKARKGDGKAGKGNAFGRDETVNPDQSILKPQTSKTANARSRAERSTTRGLLGIALAA